MFMPLSFVHGISLHAMFTILVKCSHMDCLYPGVWRTLPAWSVLCSCVDGLALGCRCGPLHHGSCDALSGPAPSLPCVWEERAGTPSLIGATPLCDGWCAVRVTSVMTPLRQRSALTSCFSIRGSLHACHWVFTRLRCGFPPPLVHLHDIGGLYPPPLKWAAHSDQSPSGVIAHQLYWFAGGVLRQRWGKFFVVFGPDPLFFLFSFSLLFGGAAF